MLLRILLISVFSSFFFQAHAQYTTVRYDFEKNWFGENQLLPAESSWMLTGVIPPDIQMIEVEVYHAPDISKQPDYRTSWSSSPQANQTNYSIPINYNLRGNSKYTIAIKYYRNTSKDERSELKDKVKQAAESYLDMNITAHRNSVDLAKHPRLMKQDLDKLVQDGMVLYRNDLNQEYRGFSQLVTDQLNNLEELRLKDGRFNILKKEDDADNSERVRYFQEQVENLKMIVNREIDQYLSYDFYVLDMARVVTDYSTEKTRTVLPINVGYGAMYNDGDFDNLSYATAPFVGISIPLANKNFSSKFWSNSSLSAGVFIENFDVDERNQYTGPFIDRPFYLAYGYKTAYFLRFNAGVTVLEDMNRGGDVFVRPFIGVSIELNLWLGITK